MGSGWSAPGVNHTAEYMASGIPWVTGSLVVTGVTRIEFPNVTKFFKISNTGLSSVSVGFTPAGVGGDHGFTVQSGSVQHFELRIRDLFLSGTGGTVDILGGVTGIPRKNYQPLTGGNPPPDGWWYLEGIE